MSAFFANRRSSVSPRTRKGDRVIRACLDQLEGRTLLSASLSNGVLTANGTAGNDDLRLDLVNGQIVVHLNGGTEGTFAPAAVKSIQLNGLDGDDSLRVGANIMGARLNGGNGNDFLTGGFGNDTLDGGAGNDVLDGKQGADQYVGGAGFDNADYRFETANLTLSLDGVANELGGNAQGDNLGVDVERIVSGSGSDRITGSNADNSITARDGNDTVFGLGGNDSIDGDAGNDSIDGGAGNDVLTGFGGADTMIGGDGTDSFIANDGARDTLVGGAGADQAVADAVDVASEIEAGVGQPAAPEITVTQGATNVADGGTTINFGSATKGQAAPTRVFTVKNDGRANLTLGAVTLPAGYALAEGLSSTLAPGASDTFTVRLDTAAAAGTKAGQVSVANNDANENPFNFAVTGVVNNPAPPPVVKLPEVTVTLGGANVADGATAAIGFGAVTKGQAAPTKTFVVKNDGQADLTLGALSVPAGFGVVDGLVAKLAPGASDTFTIRLDTAAAGAKAGQVSFANNDSNENPFNFAVTGTVNNPAPPPPVAKYPEVTVTMLSNGMNITDGATTAIGFGAVTKGQAGPTRTFRVKNDGQAALTLGAVTVPAGFKVIDPLTGPLAPGASESFVVQLDTSAAGNRSGQVSFANNDPNEGPFNFTISGVVNNPTAPPPPPTTPPAAKVTASLSAGGTLTVMGTPGNDSIVMTNPGSGIVITWNGNAVAGGPFKGVKRIVVDAGDGNDLVYLTDLNVAASVDGGNGSDTIRAGTGGDSVNGSGGADVIEGYLGNDTLHGGAGNDLLIGGPGLDHIYGDEGDDTLQAADGLGDDMVDGGSGSDTIRKDRTDTATGT